MGKKANNGQAGGKSSGGQNRKSNSSSPMSAGKIGVIVIAILAVVAIAVGLSEIDTEGTRVPSGSVCADNVAYLQGGVDSYREAFGEFPTTLEQLLETKDGKGPFVERIDLRCPSTGKPYRIQDGVVSD